MRRTRQSGFSLLEMLLVVAILTIVMGVVFNQINQVQKRSRVEEMKVDMTQNSREFMDQLIRDLHSIGYPTKGMFPNAGTGDSRVAAGLVKIAYDEIWFEGDVDGDGQVDVIDYKLTPTSGSCPCTITRNQALKLGIGVMSENHTSNATTSLERVINSGNGGTGKSIGTPQYSISGSSFGTSNDSAYSNYKGANVFTFFDASGGEVTPTDIGSNPSLSTTVRTIQININVLAPQADLQTRGRPVMSYSAAVRLPNQ